MSDLRSLFPDARYNIVNNSPVVNTLYVYNNNEGNQNGGRC